jgi:lipopolysaccharide transport system permease protein
MTDTARPHVSPPNAAPPERRAAALRLFAHVVAKDFTDRYAGSVFGWGWAFAQPLAMILIFTVIFAGLMGQRLGASGVQYGYGVYLVAGLIPWTIFATTLNRLTSVFTEKRALIAKLPMNLLFFPATVVAVETINFAIMILIFVAILVLMGMAPGWSFFWIVPLFLIQQSAALAVGAVLGVCHVFFRDMRELVGVAIQFLFWLTPIVYVVTILPPVAQAIQSFNPLHGLMTGYRAALLDGAAPGTSFMILSALGTLGCWAFAGIILRRAEKPLRDLLS